MDTGMVFAMIFAVLFIGFLLAYAFNSIGGFFCFTAHADTMSKVNDLKSSVGALYAKSQGSSAKFDLHIPADSKICFFDAKNNWTNTNHFSRDRYWDPTNDNYIMLQLSDSLSSNYGSNVWIYYCGGSQGFKIDRLVPYEGSNVDLTANPNSGNFCAPPNTELTLVNNGTNVIIKID